MALSNNKLQARRTRRNRFNIKKRANGRPRLSVFRSNQHIYVQLIDDIKRCTLAAASTVEKDFKGSGATAEAAAKVGALIAKRSLKAGVKEVVFDRGAYLYHGRVKALAEAAREEGLSF